MDLNIKPRIKPNNIWSNTLLESNLCDDICSKFASFDNRVKTNNPDIPKDVIKQNRDIESYDFTTDINNKTSSINTNAKKNHLSSIDHNKDNQIIEAKTKSEPLTERIGPMVQFDENKSREHIIANELDSDDLVTKEIVKHLNEPKTDMIKRVVTVLGKKKALELLYATEDIQSSGGMLTTEGNRRYRTAGGVYIQLLRKDDTILNCQRKKIFIEDMERKKLQKKAKRLNQQRRFNLAKTKLKEQVLQDSKQQTAENESEEDMDKVNEEEMIYFE